MSHLKSDSYDSSEGPGRYRVSDHPETPRVEFNGDGESMNVAQAIDRLRRIIAELAEHTTESWMEEDYNLKITVRSCDCGFDIRGRDEHCVLHGDADDPDPSVFECEECGAVLPLAEQSAKEFVCKTCNPATQRKGE